MPRKSDIVFASAVGGGLMAHAGELIAQLDAHRVGEAILAITAVLFYAIHKWTPRGKR